jgi:hypothetical protein
MATHRISTAAQPWTDTVPTVLRIGAYRFFFYAGDRDEPQHVHVESNDGTAKFWLDAVRLQRSSGLARSEIGRLHKLVIDQREHLLRAWNEYFSD